MKEKIILAPGANSSEILRNMALHEKNSLGLKIMGSAELSSVALMRSGIQIKEELLSRDEENPKIAEAMKGVGYFKNPRYADIKNVAIAIYTMRRLLPANEAADLKLALDKGIFRDKNDALYEVYEKYMEICKKDNLLDTVGLIRKAITEAKPLAGVEFEILKEYPLMPLDKALLEKVSGGNYSEKSISELLGVIIFQETPSEFGKKAQECSENISDVTNPKNVQAGLNSAKVEDIRKCYGSANETEMIIDSIYRKSDDGGNNLDRCTVAVSDPQTYAQLFFDLSMLYDIPMTFGCGIPITNSNPAKLLVLYYRWISGDIFGGAELSEMLNSDAFDRKKLLEDIPADGKYECEPGEFLLNSDFENVLYGLRLTNNADVNKKRIDDFKSTGNNQKYVPALEYVAEILELPAEDFIAGYSRIRKGKKTHKEVMLMALDREAIETIRTSLALIRSANLDQDEEDIIKNVLNHGACTQNSAAGTLHITTIEKARESLKDELYICGMSALMYPGAPKENYLVLDDDLKNFAENPASGEAETLKSDEKIKQKIKGFNELIKLASGLGCKVHISYPELNVAELKDNNESSLIFDLGNVVDNVPQQETVGYFDPQLSKTYEIGRAYNEGKEIEYDAPAGNVMPKANQKKEYSFTAISDFLKCPRRFELKHILGVEEPEDNKPFEVIDAKTKGLLAHAIMKRQADEFIKGNPLDKAAFDVIAEEVFDNYIKETPPVVPHSTDNVKKEFLEMMGNAFNMSDGKIVVDAEKDIHETYKFTNGDSLNLHGFVDRIERRDDDKYVIVDFKTGRSIEHKENDADSCLQAMLYAYMVEKQNPGKRIDKGEFWYIGMRKVIGCDYDDTKREKLNEALTKFKTDLDDGKFAPNANKDSCKYCKYGTICGRNEEN